MVAEKGKAVGRHPVIGESEAHICRTLMASDFTDAPVNDPYDPNDYKSDRLLNRLQATEGRMPNMDGLIEWMLADAFAKLSPKEQVRFRERWWAMGGGEG
jgi:hypothetical protein